VSFPDLTLRSGGALTAEATGTPVERQQHVRRRYPGRPSRRRDLARDHSDPDRLASDRLLPREHLGNSCHTELHTAVTGYWPSRWPTTEPPRAC